MRPEENASCDISLRMSTNLGISTFLMHISDWNFLKFISAWMFITFSNHPYFSECNSVSTEKIPSSVKRLDHTKNYTKEKWANFLKLTL